MSTPARDRSAVRPPSRASPAPTGNVYTGKRSVGWQAAIAGKPGSHRECVHRQEIGRLAGRHRGQARLPQGMCTPARDRSAGRPPSRASPLPQKAKHPTPALAPHHSPGRALARLQLLILIHPPLREAEWRCSSGEWRAAPFDAVEHAACRSKRSRPEGSVPGGIPERRNAEPQRGAGRSGRAFFCLLFFGV